MAEYIVSSGEISSGIILNNAETMTVLDGGTATITTVNSEGIMHVSSGGFADSTTVNSRGSMYVSSGGTADSTTVNSRGSMYVSSGGIADHTTVNSDGNMYILSGGTANSATADTGACIRISSGATATAIVENGGYVYVANSATVSFVENTFSGCVLSRASATVHSGTTAIDATVKDWAFLYVSSGGIVNSATIDVDGIISVLGGTVNSVTVNADGSMHIRDGGTADGTIMTGGGCLLVYSGGTATNIVWTPCEGYVDVYEGGYVTFASEYSGVYYGSGNKLLSSASVMDGKTLDDNYEMYVMNGGTADSTTVNYDGNLYVRDGGTAKNTEVNEGGTFVVSSGGTANSATVNGGGMIVEDSGTADSITVNGGEFQVSAGGSAANIMLASGGELYVYYGGVATGIVENGGYVDFEDDESVSFVSNSFSGLVLSDASATVHSGTTANSATVNEYGSLRVHSGGIVNSTTVNEYGSLRVYSGGTADSTTVNGGEFEVSEGGMANGATVNCGGSMYVSAGGTATGILENGGYVEIDGGANVTFLSNTLSGLVLNYGRYATVHTSTTATSATLDFNGGLYVRGGQADHTTVNDGGEFEVSDDGRADSTTVNDGGSMIVADRGKAVGIAIHAGGNLEVGSGGSASDATVNSGGSAIVGDGGKAAGVSIHAGGSLEVGSGGSANDATVNSGANMFVASNGTATGITVYAGGRLELGAGGTIQSAAISSGGIVTGHVDCQGITFDPGAELQLDLSVISPGNESALVNLAGLAETPDCPSFTLPVSDSQDYGDYRLAENARGFETKTISVYNSVADFGSLSLDRSVVVGNREYKLNLNDGDLILSVNATHPTQYVYLDFDGEVLARYKNPDLELSFDLSVTDPEFSDEQRAAVVSALSERYGKYNIAFTLERPEDIEFSTLYFGVSSAFDEYGDFFGISETCDGNDQVRDDNAFVLLDSGYSDEQILSVASHMLDHIMGFSWSGSVDGSPAILKYAESKALLSLSAGWDQEDPYNKYCPIYPVTGERCVVGCTNTAASQIIYYWMQNGLLDFTLSLADSDAYQSNRYIMIDSSDHPESGHLSFAETNKLLQSFNILDENCIAALCFAAGVVQQADYTSDETATPWNEDLFVRAGFEKDEAAEQHESGMSSYYDVLAYELLHGRPVGVSVRSQSHAIVADGYDSSRNMFHLDFGWGDETTRWYTVEEMDALRLYGGIYGYTPVASPDLTIEGLSAGKDPVEWKEDVTLTFTVSNDGKEMSEETMAYVYCGDTIIGACGIAYISPGYSRDFTCTVSSTSLKVGENILTVKVDSQNDEGAISAASVTITCMNGDVIPQTQTWEEIAGATHYVVEYSTDDFEHIVQLNADTNALDSFQLPEGNYQVRVKPDDGEEWTVIEPVVAGEVTDDPKFVRSNADGNADAFFVNAVGAWGNGYAAQHVSSAGDAWGGTKERLSLVGKNKLTDIIEGSTTDANVLLMTDDSNGDALFVDDIYSASPGELGLSQSRIALIDEIRAGAGNDIVDMTSNKFEYTGGGMTIRGGDGDDTIWANKGDNFLFGDAGNDRIVGASGNDVIVGGIGNDRMHGGGGNDVFAFCNDWGADKVKQLGTGTVTLWFASGSEDNWNAETLTYTDGDNSVKVSGITADKITLKFGDDGSDQFATLSGMGAFFDATSERVFEGILASL